MVNKLYHKVKSVLFADPKLLYKEELDLVDKPFYFEGSSGKAVLLIHGWTSVPYEVRRLGQYLNENGYTAMGPMLRGHGTVPKNLENVRWEDWIYDITQTYEELKKNHEEVYIIGTSIGANLTSILAKNKPEVAGIVLMAMPYKIKLERAMFYFGKFLLLFKKYSRKFYPPTFGLSTTITRLIAYQNYPLKNALETFKLVRVSRNLLPKITVPCFVMQSTSDHVVGKKSLEKIYAQIGSKVKRKKYIHRAYHTFISDIKNENVFEDILAFINEN